MRSLAISAAFAYASVLPAVYAGGKAIVNNHCGFDVAVWPVDIDRNPSEPTMLTPGQSYTEAYYVPAVGGVSIKIANHTTAGGPVTQLEYTVNSGDIFYDVSNIDCAGNKCPFQKHGMYLQAGKACPTVSCTAGDSICEGAYNNPDDVRTLCCTEDSPDTILHLCIDSASSINSGYAPVYGARHPDKARRGIRHPHASRHY